MAEAVSGVTSAVTAPFRAMAQVSLAPTSSSWVIPRRSGRRDFPSSWARTSSASHWLEASDAAETTKSAARHSRISVPMRFRYEPPSLLFSW